MSGVRQPFELAVATSPEWASRALADPAALLLDLAHCEKKAAGAVLAFLFRDPGAEAAAILSRLAREELTHFEWCLRELSARGLAFERQIPTEYAAKLANACRRGPDALLDNYLVAAIIEARSGERLALLRDTTEDRALHALFSALHPPEERHVEVLFGLAEAVGAQRTRLAELLAIEAGSVTGGARVIRVHG